MSKDQVRRHTLVGSKLLTMQAGTGQGGHTHTHIHGNCWKAKSPILSLMTVSLIAPNWTTALLDQEVGFLTSFQKWTYLPNCSCPGATAFGSWTVIQTRETGVCFIVLKRLSPSKEYARVSSTPNVSICFCQISFCTNRKFWKYQHFLLDMVCILPNASHLQQNSVATWVPGHHLSVQSPTLACIFHLFQWNFCARSDLWRQNPVVEKYCQFHKTIIKLRLPIQGRKWFDYQ